MTAHEKHGAPLVAVVRDQAAKDAYMADTPGAIDGDAHDLRFLDPASAIVYLKAKGRAKKDTSGFVLDRLPEQNRPAA